LNGGIVNVADVAVRIKTDSRANSNAQEFGGWRISSAEESGFFDEEIRNYLPFRICGRRGFGGFRNRKHRSGFCEEHGFRVKRNGFLCR